MDLEPPPDVGGRWLDSLAARAQRVVHPAVWSYLESGSYGEVTVGEATRAWSEVRFRPRVLRGATTPDLRTTLLGNPVASPVGVAPTAMQRAIHPLGERATVAGAEAAGALCVLSSNCGTRWDELGGTSPWWLQAYLPSRRELMLPVLEGAVAAGASAIVLTVDTPFPGSKYAADAEDWTGIDLSWWRVNFADPEFDRWAPDLGVDDIGWLRDRTGLPVVVKGVLRADDALRCIDAGAAAIYVSNHGGRQLDRAVSTASALRDIAAAVGERAEVYVDGGIRTGVDVLAASALGAQAVFLGRPVLHALAVDGATGVERLLTEITAELAEVLALAGCASPGEAPEVLAASTRTAL
ncbi:MAG TPA: alpha-hydroxy acid oxidase [Nocardioides sp.]|uniref:alpha-hydroxy acid oxidase n=1 Tax=Nocardioides sp. TaxID=35761 RepID=UPI002F4215DA